MRCVEKRRYTQGPNMHINKYDDGDGDGDVDNEAKGKKKDKK